VGIDATLAAAMDAVHTLDVMVTNQFSGDPATLAVWQRDRKVEYTRRVRRATIGGEPSAGSNSEPALREKSEPALRDGAAS
jgi:hypothetical protein